ncbi:GNAT family N-acetyltransferase [Bacillus sp. JJ722]|uniref:GNAT family N-acetyltransferase n=1 Tax=Bacillus sp. JJ722 TaxID=3122973 RepID=UPI002FFEC2D2
MKNLENNIVKLIPMEITHIDGLYEAAADTRIWEHMSHNLMTRDNVEKYVLDALEKKDRGIEFPYVIVDQESKKIIGATWLLDISMSHKRLEIGSTWINPKYWRTKMNTNCKYLLLEYCFEVLQFQRVQIKTGHENIRSQQAIERLGAIKEGVLRNHMIRKEGTIRHTVMYSITNEEWPVIKKRFRTVLLKK